MDLKKIDIAEPPTKAREATGTETTTVFFAVSGYATCSSLMLITNKVAVHYLPAPSLVLISQLVASALSVWMAGQCGLIKVDKLETRKVLAFVPVAAAFLAAIFTNMKTLQYSNVETFIVFRASTPIIICVCDACFLGRELPSTRSALSLLGLAFGAVLYVLNDQQFHVTGYYWVVVWYFVFCFDQVYIKHAVETVKMESNWGGVFYTNLLASIPLVIGVPDELKKIDSNQHWSFQSIAALAVSCILGVSMSYFAFLCRKTVSATTFTVIGNCCKIATVLINVAIWNLHATNSGLACLFICLACATFYKQAPLRKELKELSKYDPL